MKKADEVAVLGGSFNPIHKGHIELAVRAVEQFDLSKLLIMPVSGTYYKSEDMLAPAQDRLNMVREAVRFLDRPLRDIIEASSLDIDRGGTTYTYDTINDLSREYKKIYFIIGMDSLMYIHTWVKAEEFLPKCILLVADRAGEYDKDTTEQINFLKERYAANIHMLKTQVHPYSSSLIRERILAGKYVGDYLPPGVYDYIKEHGLYKVAG